jgi:hypothetical protein
MKKTAMLLLVVLVCLSAITVNAAPPRRRGASVKVINQSRWDIHHLYLSPTRSDDWGPDQLGDDTIDAGTTFTLHSIRCNRYDIKVVDEDGDECVVENVSLCNDNSFWKLTNKALLACEEESED